MHHEALTDPDALTLRRAELIGHLAAAARLALHECEPADSVDFAVVATPNGVQVDCTLYLDGHTIGGWGL